MTASQSFQNVTKTFRSARESAYIIKSFACGIFRERTKTLDSCDFFTRSLPGA